MSGGEGSESINMRAPIFGVLVLAVSVGQGALAQTPAPDFRAQARCLAVYEAAASAIEQGGGDKALVKALDRNRERTALALAARRDVPAGQSPAAIQESAAQTLEGQGRDALVEEARRCDKTLGY